MARRPFLIVADGHDDTRKTVANSLRRRFGPDYEVVDFGTAEAAREELERLQRDGEQAALIVANGERDSGSGISFLAKTRDIYPAARRLVLVDFGDNSVMPSVARAVTLGQVDHFDYVPWGEADEHFLAGVGDILADWTTENGQGDPRMTVIGTRGDPAFELLSGVLQRWQAYPVAILDADTPEASTFLSEHRIEGPLPVVALADGQALTGASVSRISDTLGAGVDTESTTFDVAVVGLGPAGFSAAVNAASEGMRVILIEPAFSQASSSPMIRNYLGFPAGVSGAELMRRAWAQALMFGAVGRIGRRATGIRRERGRNVISLDDGSAVTTEVVMLAIGVEYRRLGVSNADRLVGRGVFYGFGAGDAQAMSGVDVAVIGGANSAVQAAVHLARHVRSLHLVVRGSSLRDSASEYLVEQIEVLPNVTVHLNTEVVDATGDHQLQAVTLRNRVNGTTIDQAVAGLFILIGALPRTDWLPPELARDSKGFVLTGEDGPPVYGPEQFRLPFETTMPGVFAVGDVRSGSVKRVAAAVGDGSAAIQQVLRYRARIAAIEAERTRVFGEPMPVGAPR